MCGSLADVRSVLALTALVFVGVDAPATAHPGGLNANGCHHNRKTGDYHCHRVGGLSPPPARRAQSFVGGGDAYYPNCAAVRAAGAAPIRRGEPGYRPGLDRDGDGVACE